MDRDSSSCLVLFTLLLRFSTSGQTSSTLLRPVVVLPVSYIKPSDDAREYTCSHPKEAVRATLLSTQVPLFLLPLRRRDNWSTHECSVKHLSRGRVPNVSTELRVTTEIGENRCYATERRHHRDTSRELVHMVMEGSGDAAVTGTRCCILCDSPHARVLSIAFDCSSMTVGDCVFACNREFDWLDFRGLLWILRRG